MSPHRKLDRHLGTRGWILVLCAAIWFLIGLGLVLRAAKDGDPALLHLYIPSDVRLVGWWAGAVLAVYGAACRKHLPVVTAVLIIMPLIRFASYAWAWVTWGVHQVGWLAWVDLETDGLVTGWYSAAYHAVLIGLVLIAAHTKEPTRDGER